MEIRVVLETVEPPSGHVSVLPDPDGDQPPEALGFQGWLGLLRALSEVIERSTDSDQPGGASRR